MDVTTTDALKEWAVAIEALTAGKTILLLRKGGIREQEGRFTVARDRILLYPTYEHQKLEFLKPEYTNLVTPVVSGWHPEVVPIQAWAQITHVWQVRDLSRIEALRPYHIWNEKFVSARFNWKPKQPLYVLLLRTYRIDPIQEIPYHQDYGVCRSWIELKSPISISSLSPILNDFYYKSKFELIKNIVFS